MFKTLFLLQRGLFHIILIKTQSYPFLLLLFDIFFNSNNFSLAHPKGRKKNIFSEGAK